MDALKPGGRDWTVKEQILRDALSGLTLQFEVAADGRRILRILGDALPSGNQEITFSAEGAFRSSRVAMRGPSRAGWIKRERQSSS